MIKYGFGAEEIHNAVKAFRGKTLEKLEKAYNLPIEITHTAEEIDEAADAAAQATAQAETAGVQAQMLMDQNKEQAKAAAQIEINDNK